MKKFFAAICLFILVAQTPLFAGRNKIHPAALLRANGSLAQDARASDAPSPDEAEVIMLPAEEENVDPDTGNPQNTNLLNLSDDSRGVIIEFLFPNFKDVANFMYAHPTLAQSVKNYFFRESNSEIPIKLSAKLLELVFRDYAPLDEGEVAGYLAAHRNLRSAMLESSKDYLEELHGIIFFENSEDNRQGWSQASNAEFDRLTSLINERLQQNVRYEFIKKARSNEKVFANAIDREGLAGLIIHLKKAISAAKKRECCECCEWSCDHCCDDCQRECFFSCDLYCCLQAACFLVCWPCILPGCLIQLCSRCCYGSCCYSEGCC